ncbi:MAG: murein transglycosylase domain-containing protein, partial [Campylobacteraceae bacterium]
LYINFVKTQACFFIYFHNSIKFGKIMLMKKIFLLSLIFIIFLSGCSVWQQQRVIKAATSDNPEKAFKALAESRAKQYAQNPNLLKADLKSLENIAEAFSNLRKAVKNEWGEKETKEPAPKEYVKYLNDYKSRAIIDYENSVVYVGTVDEVNPKESLFNAIVTTLLMPHDPSGADLFNSNDIKLGGEPYLYNEVLDNENQPIRWEWRAKNFATYLINNKIQTRKLENKKTAYYVEIKMVQKNQDIRANKYQDLVQTYAKKYNLDTKLVYAIIKTESDFNQYAISKSGAVGLMQIMPATAGADAYQDLYGKKGQPTRDYLFDPKNNIEMGTTYINILNTRYLKDVKNQTSREYCVISSYNGGSGLVLRTFHSDRTKAFSEINAKSSAQIYSILTTKVSAEETRNYLVKVTNNKKQF